MIRPSFARTALRVAIRPVSGPSIPAQAIFIPSTTRLFTSTPLILKKNKGANTKSPKQKIRVVEDDEAGANDDPGAGEVVISEVLEKTEAKIEKAVHWAKAVIFEGVERGRGRVTPALLDSVRVSLPDNPGQCHLNAVASITTKGNALFVEIWDTDATKHVESAIHQANLPGISPQKTGANTLKIPISRPTTEQRAEILRSLSNTVEAAKQQIRIARTDGFKHLGGRKSNGTDEIQKLVDEASKDLDGQMVLAKKEFEKA
ncbi:uncharacterized protein I206_103207 [Kwoniella pini CBS 10737]|uniref:Ribosome recycling factor n=1 Tax=Kwoniella pini CBS 10737 TaxID=1296096 RepID=A0A1B9IA81_9TREE|nr:ribosome recycling factor [Kwoniella pini CBS 10737]OCF52498.1 ribosome recycling factor [Kwoniella pini CBS 10737]